MTEIFVFGSNLAGVHGGGAEGIQGHSYGIPTKDHRIETRPLADIQVSVTRFMEFAGRHLDLTFRVTRIGCGLAGYTDSQIAPMFAGAPGNCVLPDGWRDWGKR